MTLTRIRALKIIMTEISKNICITSLITPSGCCSIKRGMPQTLFVMKFYLKIKKIKTAFS